MEREKTDWKTPVIVVVAVIVLAIIILMVIKGSFSKNVAQGDIQISDFKYESEGSQYFPFSYDQDNGKIMIKFKTTISTNREGLHLMVYDDNNNAPVNFYFEDYYGEDGKRYDNELKDGANTMFAFGNFYLSSLSQQPKLRFCVSTKDTYDENLKGMKLVNPICEVKTFDNPEFKYEITPDPLTFYVSKEIGTWDNPHQILKIKNVGKNVVPGYIFVPVSNELSVNPRYYAEDKSSRESRIKPGEIYEYEISLSIGGDLPLGTYETQGFIYGIPGDYSGSIFKKEFTLKTIVTP